MSQKGKKINSAVELKKQNAKVVFIRISIILLIALLLIMSTYAWFTSQRDITLSNLRGTVEVAENLEISLDAKLWYHEIDLSEINNGKTALQLAYESRNLCTSGTAQNMEPIQLLPVSTIGLSGKNYVPFYSGEANAKKTTSLSGIAECKEFDESYQIVDNGYFAFDIYIKNTSRDDELDTLQLNLNSAVQVLTKDVEKTIIENGVQTTRIYKGQAYSGIQNTVRVALGLYEDTAGVLATQEEILNATKGSKISKVAIWEPNAPYHVEYIVNNNNNLKGSGAKTFANGDELTTYALTPAAVAAKRIEDVYNTDDPSLQAQVALKTAMKNTVEGSEDYRILSEDGKPFDITDVNGDLFQIEANKVSRLRVYVWLEGQDIDCVNLASFGGGIEMDLGMTKDNAVGEVLTRPDDPATNTVP